MVPFEGDIAQTLVMGRGQQSDFVFVDIVEPTLPDITVPKDLIEEDSSSIQTYQILETPVEEESPIQEYPVPEIPVEEAVLEPVDEAPRAATPEPGPFCDEPEPASGEAETHNFCLVSWDTSRKGRQKQKAVLTFDLPSLVEDYPAKASVEEPLAEVKAYPVECIVELSSPPEPEPNECIVEENPVPEPEPVDETYLEGDIFSPKKSKKRGKKSNQEFWKTFDEPIIEVEPAHKLEPVIKKT
ncbi:hypothetical protein NA56DRAFT_299145 [Hyaloscypha hepaticicola]|uniref:Uncharacterized protein n=1 Tax=Hyaloscypha hepaticicola TaxID=2082293 RepID=A0A2J6QKT2_9HELO|nr:hypothetical protein NA56DRAFT_299145 [Hyaloscypha hepaticicola]